MVQLSILTGKQAGSQKVARRFPVRVGRAPDNDLVLDSDGVWQRHFEIHFDSHRGFIWKPVEGAFARVNGNEMAGGVLRNGDVLEAGAAKIQFWLGRTCPGGIGMQEALAWALICFVSLGQILLIYWLLSL